MGNGEQVIMATRLPSLGKSYEHVPNGIVNFIKNQCRFNGVHSMFADIKFGAIEQEFIEDVFYGERPLIKRFEARQTGGSTLLALIASYYALHGKKVIMLFSKLQLAEHMMRVTFPSFTINGIWMESPNKKTIELRSLNAGKESVYIDIIHNDNFIRATMGRSADYIFMDASPSLSKEILLGMMSNLMPGGKMIINGIPTFSPELSFML